MSTVIWASSAIAWTLTGALLAAASGTDDLSQLSGLGAWGILVYLLGNRAIEVWKGRKNGPDQTCADKLKGQVCAIHEWLAPVAVEQADGRLKDMAPWARAQLEELAVLRRIEEGTTAMTAEIRALRRDLDQREEAA